MWATRATTTETTKQQQRKQQTSATLTETTQQVDRETTRQVGINQEKINEFCSENVNADHEIIEFLANIYLKTIFIKDDLKEVSELIDNLSQKAPNNDCCSVCRCWPVQKPQPRQIQP